MFATALPDCRVDVAAVGGAGELAVVLAQYGVALFDGLRSEQELMQLASRLGRILPHRDSNPAGITVLAHCGDVQQRPGQAGFSQQPLAPHTDCSDRTEPPLLVMAVYVRPAEPGGNYVFVDGQAVHAELATTAPDALADLSTRRGACSAVLPGSWATSSNPARISWWVCGCGVTSWHASPRTPNDGSPYSTR